MKARFTLPRGVGLIRIMTPLGRVVLESDRLTQEQANYAKAIAAYLATTQGHTVVLLREIDLALALAVANLEEEAAPVAKSPTRLHVVRPDSA